MLAFLTRKLGRVISACKAQARSTSLGKGYITLRAKRRWARFHVQYPALVEYSKPYRTPRDLAHKLILQGLSVPDRKLAETTIFRENYFRFKAYLSPFFDKTTDKFHRGATFDDLQGLYCADQKLRDFLIRLLAQLEIRIRATVDNVTSD